MRSLVIATTLLLAQGAAAQAPLDFFSLASGELDGGYHRAAQAICAEVNAAYRGEARCSPETTPGSRYNVDALLSAEVDFAIVQADVARRAMTEGEDRLRLVSQLYDETLTLLVRPEANIRGLGDFQGARVDIGPPASGRNATIRAILSALDTPADHFRSLTELPGASAIDALCTGAVEAVLLVVGHPSALVERATAVCGARVVPFLGPRVSAFAAQSGYLRLTAIPAFGYTALEDDVPTLGMRAGLLTRADVPEGTVRLLAAAILDARGRLGAAASELEGLDAAAMRDPLGGPPLHPGAAAAFAGAG